jgi:hypothetical protein
MALQRDTETGLVMNEIHEAWTASGVRSADLAARLGWQEEVIDIIDTYKGKSTRLSFPTIEEVRAVLPERFEEMFVRVPGYDMGPAHVALSAARSRRPMRTPSRAIRSRPCNRAFVALPRERCGPLPSAAGVLLREGSTRRLREAWDQTVRHASSRSTVGTSRGLVRRHERIDTLGERDWTALRRLRRKRSCSFLATDRSRVSFAMGRRTGSR